MTEPERRPIDPRLAQLAVSIKIAAATCCTATRYDGVMGHSGGHGARTRNPLRGTSFPMAKECRQLIYSYQYPRDFIACEREIVAANTVQDRHRVTVQVTSGGIFY